jgi:phosphinothricin acetyltransferase
MIRPAGPQDSDALAALYNHYVLHSVTTFETETIDGGEMARRIEEVQKLGLPWIVLESDSVLCGYACAVRWKGRDAYRHSVESTIYLAEDCAARGFGTTLYTALLGLLEDQDLHCALAGIALPNEASVALHEKLGFEKVAHLREVGHKFERWIDVGYWQRLLG